MTPRPPVPPRPPLKALKAMQHSGGTSDRPDAVIFRRYWSGLKQIGGLKILVAHYVIIVLLLALFWKPAMGAPVPHPEILVKLVGAFCFLIGTLVIPLAAHELFPSPGDTDPAFDSIPMSKIAVFDARLRAVTLVSAMAVFPVIPLFLVFNPLMGRGFDLLDITPFFISTATAVWVFFLMELGSGKSDPGERFVRRLSVIAAFILLHLGLVGLVARLARPFFQYADWIKLLVNVNPFSQFYILMEGPDQTKWLLFNTPWLRNSDYRLYLLTIMLIVLLSSLAVYRALLRQSDDEFRWL